MSASHAADSAARLSAFLHDLDPACHVVGRDGVELDSAALVELVLWLESTFQVQLALDDIEPDDLRSFSKLLSLIGAARG